MCHPRDEKRRFSPLMGREKEIRDRDQLMALYHDRCIGCHEQRAAAGKKTEAKEIELAARRSLNPAQIVVPQADRRLELLVTDLGPDQIEGAVREEARVAPTPPRARNGAAPTP